MHSFEVVFTHLDISIDPEKDEKVVTFGFSLTHVWHKEHAASTSCGASRKPKAGLRAEKIKLLRAWENYSRWLGAESQITEGSLHFLQVLQFCV